MVLNPGGFVATHSGLTAVQRQKAVSGQSRVLGWMATNAAGDRLGTTIYEVGEAGGPGFPGRPAARDYAVTSFNHATVRVGTTGLTVAGTALDAQSVRVTLKDRSAATADPTATAVLSRATGVQAFRASFTAAQLRRLADGTLTAVGSYTVGAAAIGGVDKAILKDMRVPGAPTSDTRSGVYRRSQSVILSLRRGESPSSKIYFTTNRTRPTLSSMRFVRPIRITATKTLRAIVVDSAGNRSLSRLPHRPWMLADRHPPLTRRASGPSAEPPPTRPFGGVSTS